MAFSMSITSTYHNHPKGAHGELILETSQNEECEFFEGRFIFSEDCSSEKVHHVYSHSVSLSLSLSYRWLYGSYWLISLSSNSLFI